jgi:hypothetical protein
MSIDRNESKIAGHRRANNPENRPLPLLCEDPVSKIESLQELPNAHPMMRGNVLQDTTERARFDGMMVRNDFVVFAVALGCYANLGAPLERDHITQNAERFYLLRPVNIARQPHWTRTSSRTKCRRMIFGDGLD